MDSWSADGRGVRLDVHVEALPAQVWRLVGDIALPARFSPELQRVRWLDGATRPAVGARFEGHNRHPALGEWRTVSEVVDLEAERVLGWAVLDVDGRFGDRVPDVRAPVAHWRFELAPEAGGTRLGLGVRLGPARSGLSPAIDRNPASKERIVRGRLEELRTGMLETLDGIRALAEQDSWTRG